MKNFLSFWIFCSLEMNVCALIFSWEVTAVRRHERERRVLIPVFSPKIRKDQGDTKIVFFWKYRVLGAWAGRDLSAFISFSKVVLPWTWFNWRRREQWAELFAGSMGKASQGGAAHWGLLTDNQSPVGPRLSGQSPATSGCFRAAQAGSWSPESVPLSPSFSLPCPAGDDAAWL